MAQTFKTRRNRRQKQRTQRVKARQKQRTQRQKQRQEGRTARTLGRQSVQKAGAPILGQAIQELGDTQGYALGFMDRGGLMGVFGFDDMLGGGSGSDTPVSGRPTPDGPSFDAPMGPPATDYGSMQETGSELPEWAWIAGAAALAGLALYAMRK